MRHVSAEVLGLIGSVTASFRGAATVFGMRAQTWRHAKWRQLREEGGEIMTVKNYTRAKIGHHNAK